MAVGGGFWGLEGSKCHSYLQQGRSQGLQASPWEGDGRNPEGQEGEIGMDIRRGNHDGLTWQPSKTRWLAQWMKGEQMTFNSILARLSKPSHVPYVSANCWNMDQVSRLWGAMKSERTTWPKRLWTAARSPAGCQSLSRGQYCLTSSLMTRMMGQSAFSASSQAHKTCMSG